MSPPSAGRPRSFDRDLALKRAACLFWRHGFSGTSTRMLAASLGLSSSSLYAAFGSKTELFEEAVRTYALRYSAIYSRALDEPMLAQVIERLLVDSVYEFSRSEEGHPGCLTSSAAMADAPATLDVRAYVADLQQADEARLRARVERAVLDREVSADPAVLTGLVLAVWQGLSMRSDLGAGREELIAVARLSSELICQRSAVPAR